MSLWAWILRGGAAVYLHTGYPRYIVPVNRGYEGYEQRYELNTKYPLDYLPANSILRQTTGENKRFVMALGVEIKQRLTGQKLWDNCNHLATFIKAGYIRRIHTKACTVVEPPLGSISYLLHKCCPLAVNSRARRPGLCWPPAYRDNDGVFHNTSSTMWLPLVTSR